MPYLFNFTFILVEDASFEHADPKLSISIFNFYRWTLHADSVVYTENFFYTIVEVIIWGGIILNVSYQVMMEGYFYYKNKQFFLKDSDCLPFWVLFAVESGCFRYHISGICGVANPGEIVICPPHVSLNREFIHTLTLHSIALHYTAPNTEEERQMINVLHHLLGYKFTTHERVRMTSNFHQLSAISEKYDTKSMQWKNHLINDIWMLLSVELDWLLDKEMSVKDPLMHQAKDFMDSHLSDDILIKDVAFHVKLHPVHFSRRFQAIFNISPVRYLSSIRIEKVKMLLAQTEYTIDHIAHLCGYANGFYLSRVFTKFTGMTPSQYHKMFKKILP